MSLLSQVKQLEGKIQTALEAARSVQSERDHLSREVGKMRGELEKARSDAETARTELASATKKLEALSREKQDLERERGEVLERVEHLIASLAEIEAAAAAT